MKTIKTSLIPMLLLILTAAFSITGCSDAKKGVTELEELSSASKTATSNYNVSLSQTFDPSVGAYIGSFTSTGFVSGSGSTYEVVNATFPPFNANPNGQINATYTFQAVQTLTYAYGSITFNLTGKWWWINPGAGEAHASASWNVISGTGSYSGIKGSGTLESELTLTQALEGSNDIWEGYLWYPSVN